MTVFINVTTGNAVSAAGTLIGFIVFGAIIFALMKRFA
jgi:amino acid permease